jgi:hypothetical protein
VNPEIPDTNADYRHAGQPAYFAPEHHILVHFASGRRSASSWGGPISIKEQSPDHVDEKDCDKGIPYHLTEPDSRIVVVGVRSLPAHDAL